MQNFSHTCDTQMNFQIDYQHVWVFLSLSNIRELLILFFFFDVVSASMKHFVIKFQKFRGKIHKYSIIIFIHLHSTAFHEWNIISLSSGLKLIFKNKQKISFIAKSECQPMTIHLWSDGGKKMWFHQWRKKQQWNAIRLSFRWKNSRRLQYSCQRQPLKLILFYERKVLMEFHWIELKCH